MAWTLCGPEGREHCSQTALKLTVTVALLFKFVNDKITGLPASDLSGDIQEGDYLNATFTDFCCLSLLLKGSVVGTLRFEVSNIGMREFTGKTPYQWITLYDNSDLRAELMIYQTHGVEEIK